MARLAHAAPAAVPSFARTPAAKIALWWFLASEIMTFGGLIASYVVMRLGGGPEWAQASAHLRVELAAVNTVVLLTSSFTIVQAFVALERGDEPAFRRHMALTVLAGLAFLALKAVEYTGEIRQGYTPTAGIFWSFYYGLTGLHALHVAALNFMHLRFEGGLIWAIALVPLAFFAVLTLALLPDFVLGR
jgi:heme/copper-type cytochrome/quinol oxidase subunit 3